MYLENNLINLPICHVALLQPTPFLTVSFIGIYKAFFRNDKWKPNENTWAHG